MHNLFGDRFLRLFAGDLQRRQKRTKFNFEDQTPEVKAEYAADLVPPGSEEGHEKNLADGNQLPDEQGQNKKEASELIKERD